MGIRKERPLRLRTILSLLVIRFDIILGFLNLLTKTLNAELIAVSESKHYRENKNTERSVNVKSSMKS